MAQASYQTVPVACPGCQFRFSAPILTVVDVDSQPQAKDLLLSGQLNIAACPQCGRAGMLSVPFVYHDHRKELLFTLMPPDVSASEADKQKVIGELTNQVLASLPSEERKAYLLQPRSFLTIESMREAIYEADGITREMLEEQRAKASLLARLMDVSDETARRAIVEENETLVDYVFFEYLTFNIDMAVEQGQEELTAQLTALREQLLDWTTKGQELAQREEALRSIGEDTTRESLLDAVVEAGLAGESAKLETLVAIGRPLIDYQFYQQLTGRIDSAKREGRSSESAKLTELREKILEVTAAIDARVEEEAQRAAEFLQDLLDSSDPETLVRDQSDRVDPVFLEMLQGNLEAAEQRGETKFAERLKVVEEIVVRLIEEGQPPEVRLISRLMSAEYPDGTQQLLVDNQDQLGDEFLVALAAIAEDLKRRGQTDLAERLERIAEQAAALVAPA